MLDSVHGKAYLFNCIGNLDKFPHATGGEGSAYFINDNLVVKKYTKKDDTEFCKIFDYYCKEMQKFGRAGLNVPEIYAWTIMPNIDRKSRPHCKFDYYILEERMKGRQIYHGYLDNVYSLCEDLCSKSEFKRAVKIPNLHEKLFKEILLRYIKDYQEMNEYLCTMPKGKIDKFIYDLYMMCSHGKFSVPDVFATNILIDIKGKGDFSIIDNRAEQRLNTDKTSKEYAERVFTNGLLWLFMFNSYVTNENRLVTTDDKYKGFVLEQRDKVTKPCKETIIRFIERAKAVCCDLQFNENDLTHTTYMMLRGMLSEADANEIFSHLERE